MKSHRPEHSAGHPCPTSEGIHENLKTREAIYALINIPVVGEFATDRKQDRDVLFDLRSRTSGTSTGNEARLT